jgi:alkaline phosphatase
MRRPSRRPLARLACAAVLLATAAGARAADPTANSWYRAGRAAVAAARDAVGTVARARNVILFVGDGMGITTVTAARIRQGQLHGQTGEENVLAFETLPFTALAKTYSTDFQVSDSAATITAMLSGLKTRSGVIGVDETVARDDAAAVAAGTVPTLFEQAEDRGMWTGVVTTTRITHATPAGAYAHTADRDWEQDGQLTPAAREAGVRDIARQLVEVAHGDGFEVVLGGGRAAFLPATARDPQYPDQTGARTDGQDLIKAWQTQHPDGAWVWTRDQLHAVDVARTPRVLGLFAPSHMHYEADRAADAPAEPSLAEMTGRALDVLERAPKGYVLLVEGGRIDHAHHAGNAYRALGETIAFSDAVRVALERTKRDDTLIVVTADHSHTLQLAGYPKRGNPILGLVRGSSGEGAVSNEPSKDLSGRPYTTLSYANGPGYTGASDAQPEGPKHFPHEPRSASGITAGRPDLTAVPVEGRDYLQEATVPLRGETHGGEDVPIYAGGPGAPLFHGVQEQQFVYHAIASALGWTN